MIRNTIIRNILIAVFCFCANCLHAQLNTADLQRYVTDKSSNSSTDLKQWKQVQLFYTNNNFTPVWLNEENNTNKNNLLSELKLSSDLGLKETEYQNTLITSLRNGTVQLKNINDSLQAEIQITDAALHFYNDIAYGNVTPPLAFKGITEMPVCFDIPTLLSEYISNKKLPALVNYLTPSLQEIKILQNKIKWFNLLMATEHFKEVIINSDKVTTANAPLLKKLFQLGLRKDTTNVLPDTIILQKIKDAQKQFGLLADGKLRSTTLEAFNTPIYERLQALNLSINYYRWLSCFSQNKSVIVVNIPASYLKVYNQNKILLEMRVIVGKKSTPTPTLLSTVNEVVLYPYWHVPYSIATKEILPKLKRSARVIDDGNYQVLNVQQRTNCLQP